MALDNMTEQPPMLLPGGKEYADQCIALATAASQNVRVVWDVAYGSDPRQKLDIWLPENPQGAPVCVLYHGGALRLGQKEWMGGHAPAIIAAGAIMVSPNYRLTPHAKVVDIEADCFDALAWVHHNIATYGGDPNRLIVGGHSSGGHMAGLLATRAEELEERKVPVDAIQAAFLISSVISSLPEHYSENSPGRSLFAERFSNMQEAVDATIFTHVGKTNIPFHVAFGENDSPDLRKQNWKFAGDLVERQLLTGFDIIKGADHFGAHIACCQPESEWMGKLRTFLS